MLERDRSRVVVLGAGITGLAAARWLEHDHRIEDVVVLDADDRPGGKIRSERADGHLLEWGPQGFLDNAPDTLELARVTGLEHRLVTADDASAARFIVRGGRLRRVPTSPPAFLASSLLPLGARLRVMLEPFAAGHPGGDETVFDFASRRIGPVAAEVLVDAMVTGVFAGDARRLSLAATFPRMAAMEAEHGSLTRALIAKLREARRSGRRSAGPSGPGGTLTTFTDGMEALPRALADRLGDRLRLGAPVAAVERHGDGFAVTVGDRTLRADAVLAATPSAVTARVLADLPSDALAALTATPTVPIAVVMLSYRGGDAFGTPLDGFGFLVPRGEDLGILGTLWCHSIFPGQAPDDRVFLRTMIGGAREPDAASLPDDALVARVRSAHHRLLGRDPEPDHAWVIRWSEGIAQYTVGHLDRVAAAERAARALGVELAGSPYRGVSVNDCIRQGRQAATRVAERLG
jgi:oxygen-dependent protoporphyrinogen oxidase